MNPAIIFEGVTFHYPDGRLALNNISLKIDAGEKVALVGPNGAGKSTLLLHTNGVLRGKGDISIDSINLSDETIAQIRRKVGLIFQDPNDQLFCPTVFNDVAFGPMHFGLPQTEIEALVKSSLEAVGMAHAGLRAAHHLSLGERRRVAIACVLACNPSILALDEPATGLDPERRDWLINFLKATDKTVLLATHDLSLAQEVCSRTIRIEDGRIG